MAVRKKREGPEEPPHMVFKFCGQTPCLGEKQCGWFYGPGYEDETKRGKPVRMKQ